MFKVETIVLLGVEIIPQMDIYDLAMYKFVGAKKLLEQLVQVMWILHFLNPL